MWEAISNIFTSGEAIHVEAFIVLTIIVLAVLAKFNILSFSGKFLRVGVIKDNERNIMRQQLKYMGAYLDALVPTLPEGLDFYRTKYIISKCKDFFEDMIVFNHISNSGIYVNTKKMEFLSLILGLTEKEYFKSEDWKKASDKIVEDIIGNLVKIRQEGTK